MSEWVRARIKNIYLRGLLIGLWDIFYIARLGLSFENIGSNLLRFFQTVGGISWLLLRSLLSLLLPPYRFREMFKQMEMAGWRSILLVGAVLGFLGLITVLELNFQLSRVVGSTTFVPGFAGILIFREFRNSDLRVKLLGSLMLVLFLCGLGMIGLAPMLLHKG